MEKILVVLAVVIVAVVVAEFLRRRQTDAPSQPPAVYEAPAQLDRSDFDGEDRDWLVAVFTSSTCSTCAETVARASVLASGAVAVCEVEVTEHAEMHRRYQIEAVPIVAIADSEGVVQRSFIGPVSATHLWAAVAEVREPGSVPECGDEPGPSGAVG